MKEFELILSINIFGQQMFGIFIVHCWEDSSTGNTFVGQWYQNLATKEWNGIILLL